MPSHNPYHLPGHRVADICFARREARCECGVVVTAPESHEALATAFHQHRVDVARATGRSWLHVQ